MKTFFSILFLCCYPVTSFSTQFQSGQFAVLMSTQLHLRIPRGGDHQSAEENEDLIDLDILLPTKKSSSFLAILSPFAAMLQNAGSSYSTALSTRPIVTKSCTAGVTFFLSDLCAQQIENKNKKDGKHNWTRTIVSTAVGLFYFGPAAHLWYDWVFSILPSTSLVSTLQKAALGQLIFGPIFTCVFFATSLMQSGTFSLGTWYNKIRKDLPGAWLSGTGFWPLVDLISFSLVPVKFIPLFINFCSFVWTIYLSMVSNRSLKT